jgi:predicted transcriptional regulator of viral defense system
MPGISAKEENLIATLGERGLRVFTVSEASRLLGAPKSATYKLIHQLAKKRKLQRIEKGKYLLIPPAAWKTGRFTEESIIIAAQLVSPYYVSYWTALNFYGWTEQPSRTVFIATTKLKRPVEVQGTSFKFVKLRSERFFGFSEHWVGDEKVAVANKEKTIVDCLDQPRYCGEIVEVAKGLWNGRDEIDLETVLEYAVRMKNGAISKRLGYLLDVLGINPPEFSNKLREHIGYGYVTLDPHGKSTYQEKNKDWRLRVNVSPRNITEWMTH